MLTRLGAVCNRIYSKKEKCRGRRWPDAELSKHRSQQSEPAVSWGTPARGSPNTLSRLHLTIAQGKDAS